MSPEHRNAIKQLMADGKYVQAAEYAMDLMTSADQVTQEYRGMLKDLLPLGEFLAEKRENPRARAAGESELLSPAMMPPSRRELEMAK